MVTGVTYEVRPLGEAWQIRLPGDSQSELAPSRASALARAKVLVARHGSGRILIRGERGELEGEYIHEPPTPRR